MSAGPRVSDEMLGAFLDGQLDGPDRIRVIEALRAEPTLAARLSELRQDMELLALAYRDPPGAAARRAAGAVRGAWRAGALAACALAALGALATLGLWRSPESPAPLREIAQLDPAAPRASRLIVHLGSLERARVQGTLDVLERTLREAAARGEPLQVELIANAEGLGLLRDGSPYAGRVRELAGRHENLAFLACGIAMENARLAEGAEVRLLPEARRVPAALEQILSRLREGWTYVRG